jgi:hypothetical protein
VARPLVTVYQEIQQPSGTPTTPDLNSIIVGPCYDIKDYPEDAAEILLDSTYGSLDRPAGGSDVYTPPATGEAAVTVNAYPAQSPGSVVDHTSVRIYLGAPKVILGSTQASLGSSLGSSVTTSESDRTLLTFPGGDLIAAGVRPGDRVIVTSSRGTQSVVRTVMTVGEPNADGLATDATKLRITSALPTGDAKATGRIVTTTGANIADGETFVLNDGTNPAVTFQFDSDASVTPTATLRRIIFTGSETATQMRALIKAAIDAAPSLNIDTTNYGTDGIDLINTIGGAEGNQSVTETVTHVGFVVTGMAGGATSASLWAYNATGEARIERTLANTELLDENHEYITFPLPGNDQMVLKGGISLSVAITPVPSVATPSPSTSTASRRLSYAQVYLAYRALRQDLQEIGSVSAVDVVSRSGVTNITGIGRVDARNPLAVGLKKALENSGTAPMMYFGVPSDDAGGHAVALAAMEARRDMWAVVPLTNDTSILASYKFGVDTLSDPTAAIRDGVQQKFRGVLGSGVLPVAETVYDGTINGIAQQPGASSGKYRTVSVNAAAVFSLAAVLPGDLITFGLPSSGAPSGWQNRRGTHRVSHVNNNYTDTNPAYPGNASVLEIEPGTSRWDDTAGTGAGDIEIQIKGPDGTTRVSKLAAVTITQNTGQIRWSMRAPTVFGGPYTVAYVAGTAPGITISGFAITVTYVNNVTTHNAVKALADAHTVISGIVTAEVLANGTSTVTGAVAATAVELAVSTNAAEVIINDALFDRLEDAQATFLTSNIRPGDTIEIPIDANDYTSGAFDGRVHTYLVAQVINEQRILIQNGRDDSSSASNELPHYYMRDYAGRSVDNAAPNAMRYRVRRSLSKDEQVTTLTSLAQSFRTKRVTLVWPSDVELADIPDGSVPRTVPTVAEPSGWLPGFYAAAIVGGALAGLPPQAGLTNLGFAGIRRLRYSTGYFNERQLSRLSDGGWFVLHQRRPTDLPVCLHQLTTDTTAVETGELSVVRNLDFVSMFLQDILEDFLGQYNVLPETSNEMFRAVSDGMENLKGRRVARIGPPLVDGKVNLIKVADFAKDRYQMYVNVEIAKPVNGIDLYVVV